ncbi:MAG TPA: NAD(P)-dependent oxidoreductase [Vicinamibacterales bacterium]|nr:NAD(P)-dependent oxidoreductase [Vicinamibacterales bacterium]
MKVLVADKFEKSGIDGLKAAGCEVIFEPDLKDAALVEALGRTGADVLVVRSTQVTEAMLEAGRLALIVRAGAGYNTIDVKAASRRGVYVSNCPGKNSIAVAELAFGLMIALDRRIPDNVADLQRGKWNKKEYSKAKGLAGATLGLLGFGKIGQEMAKRAMAFHMNLVIWSELGVRQDRDAIPVDLPLMLQMRRGVDAEGLIEEHISVVNTPAEVAERCDVLSIHLASSPLTKNIVNAEVIDKLKPGACVVNTARADVLDYAALARAVKEKGLRVGLDVYPGEPASGNADFASPLLGLPGVYGTHHIGASTDQAQEAIAEETVRIVTTFKQTGRVPNVVNLAKKTPATHSLIVRHKDQPGVLACLFAKLAGANINAHEAENIVFESAEAAIARINIDKEPPAALIDSFRKECPAVYEVNVMTLA